MVTLPDEMRAVVVYEPGGPEVLRLERRPVPPVREGWSLVRVRARGLNHSEVFTRKGLSPSVKFPRVLGIECVGEVASTTDPSRLPIGEKVISIMGEMGRDFDGSYADYVLLPNDQIHPVESGLPWEALAAIPETCYTAYGSMLNMRLTSGQSILVRGATSGVGIAFARLARAMVPGVCLLGSTRSMAREDLLIRNGFDEAVLDLDGSLQVKGASLRPRSRACWPGHAQGHVCPRARGWHCVQRRAAWGQMVHGRFRPHCRPSAGWLSHELLFR